MSETRGVRRPVGTVYKRLYVWRGFTLVTAHRGVVVSDAIEREPNYVRFPVHRPLDQRKHRHLIRTVSGVLAIDSEG